MLCCGFLEAPFPAVPPVLSTGHVTQIFLSPAMTLGFILGLFHPSLGIVSSKLEFCSGCCD